MMKTDARARRDLGPAWWLGLPLASLALCWLTPLLGRRQWHALMMGERGCLETGTFLWLLAALVVVGLVLRRPRGLPQTMIVLLVLFAIGLVYFAGEEISWGQHLLGFQTPTPLARINYQNEFNLHNIKGAREYLNMMPKRLIVYAVAAGAVILPLLLARWRHHPRYRSGLWDWLIPTWRLVPVSIVALLATVPHNLIIRCRPDWLDGPYVLMALIWPAEEFKEYTIALLFLLYAVSILVRRRAARAESADPPPQAQVA